MSLNRVEARDASWFRRRRSSASRPPAGRGSQRFRRLSRTSRRAEPALVFGDRNAVMACHWLESMKIAAANCPKDGVVAEPGALSDLARREHLTSVTGHLSTSVPMAPRSRNQSLRSSRTRCTAVRSRQTVRAGRDHVGLAVDKQYPVGGEQDRGLSRHQICGHLKVPPKTGS